MRCDADRLLTRGSINHQQYFLRIQKFFQLFQFLNKRFINFLAACRVENVNVWPAWGVRAADCGSYCALNLLLVRFRRKNRNVNLFAERYELLDCCGTLQVAWDQDWEMPLFF